MPPLLTCGYATESSHLAQRARRLGATTGAVTSCGVNISVDVKRFVFVVKFHGWPQVLNQALCASTYLGVATQAIGLLLACFKSPRESSFTAYMRSHFQSPVLLRFGFQGVSARCMCRFRTLKFKLLQQVLCQACKAQTSQLVCPEK